MTVIAIPFILLAVGFIIVGIVFYQLSRPFPPTSDCCDDTVRDWSTKNGEVIEGIFCMKCNKPCKEIIK